MEENKARGLAFWIVIIVALAVVTICFLFTVFNFWANVSYRESLFKNKPSLQIEKIYYYKKVLSSVSRAMALVPGDADYYFAKAKILQQAKNEGLQSKLHIDASDIEQYYIKAIELNPANAFYYSHLGLLYSRENDSRAEKNLLTALQLCPRCYLFYAELADYYLSNNQENKAFFSILELLWRTDVDCAGIFTIMMKKHAGRLKDIAFPNKSGQRVRYSLYPKTSEVSFGEVGFPPVGIPLRLQIYTKDALAEAILYYKFTPYASFTKKQGTDSGYIVYELRMDGLPSGASLNEFRLEVDSGSIIDKIDFIIEKTQYNYTRQKTVSNFIVSF